jgi:predicted nucleotidyltransferase
MGKKRPKISGLDRLLKQIKGLSFEIEKAYLFGSRVRGDYLEHSDWDLVLVSSEFGQYPFPERGSFVLKQSNLRQVDLFCYTPQEFKKKSKELGIVSEAVKGVKLI